MASYSSHNRIIRFMRVMSYGDDAICIFPSSILAGVCMEANFSEPGYVECSEKRYTFQFTVDVKANTADTSGNCMDFKSTGFPFREKADAIESAALAALEFFLHHYGVSCELYNDSVFIQHWPLYDHLSEHREESRVNVSGLIDEIVSLAKSIERSFKLFEDAKLLFDTNYEHATDVSILDNCLNELHNIHGSLVADIKPCIEVQRLCLLNRRDNRNCHEAMLRQQNEKDVKMRCSSALKLTLDRVCNRACYSVASIRCCCVSEKSYAAEVSLVDESGSAAQSKHVKIGSGNCPTTSEAERSALYTAIASLCRSGGYKIIDPSYIFLRDMQRDIHALKYGIPFLCS